MSETTYEVRAECGTFGLDVAELKTEAGAVRRARRLLERFEVAVVRELEYENGMFSRYGEEVWRGWASDSGETRILFTEGGADIL